MRSSPLGPFSPATSGHLSLRAPLGGLPDVLFEPPPPEPDEPLGVPPDAPPAGRLFGRFFEPCAPPPPPGDGAGERLRIPATDAWYSGTLHTCCTHPSEIEMRERLVAFCGGSRSPHR